MTTATPDQRHLAALIDGEPGLGEIEVAIDAFERTRPCAPVSSAACSLARCCAVRRCCRRRGPSARRVSSTLASEPSVLRHSTRRSRAPRNRQRSTDRLRPCHRRQSGRRWPSWSARDSCVDRKWHLRRPLRSWLREPAAMGTHHRCSAGSSAGRSRNRQGRPLWMLSWWIIASVSRPQG